MATARSVNLDPMQNHRFQVFDNSKFLNFNSPAAAGFNFVGLPEVNVDMHEYREGFWTYTRKYPIKPHFPAISLHKGVVKVDTTFYTWMRSLNEGRPYRTDLVIRQFHRTDVAGKVDYRNIQTASKEYRLYACMPSRYKTGSDLDPLSPDVSIEEMDIEYEYFRLFVDGNEVGA